MPQTSPLGGGDDGLAVSGFLDNNPIFVHWKRAGNRVGAIVNVPGSGVIVSNRYPTAHFSMEFQAARDTTLSLRARGLHVFMLHCWSCPWLPEESGMETIEEAISRSMATPAHEGRDSIRTAMRELERGGYVWRAKGHARGQHASTTIVYESHWIWQEGPWDMERHAALHVYLWTRVLGARKAPPIAGTK